MGIMGNYLKTVYQKGKDRLILHNMYSISNDYFCCLKIEISPLLEGSSSLEQSANYFLFKNKMHLKEDKLFKKDMQSQISLSSMAVPAKGRVIFGRGLSRGG